MIISWTVDWNLCNEKYSPERTLDHYGKCQWNFVNWKAVTVKNGSMIFNLYMAPKFHWVSASLPLIKFPEDRDNFITLENNTICLEFRYKKNREFFDLSTGLNSVEIELLSVKLVIKHMQVTLERFKSLESHKISLQMKIMQRDDGMKLRTVYFGRAQKIHTTEHAGNRYYVWTSKKEDEENTFSGVSLRRMTDLKDIDHIIKSESVEDLNMLKALVSPRPHIDYIPDNDGYSNTSKVLPLVIEETQMTNLQFFNLKYVPSKFVEFRIRWNSISPNVEQIKFPITEKITVTIDFERLIQKRKTGSRKSSVSPDKFVIKKIKFSVIQYLLSLHYLGENEVPKTI